jgi:hypothetical protein
MWWWFGLEVAMSIELTFLNYNQIHDFDEYWNLFSISLHTWPDLHLHSWDWSNEDDQLIGSEKWNLTESFEGHNHHHDHVHLHMHMHAAHNNTAICEEFNIVDWRTWAEHPRYPCSWDLTNLHPSSHTIEARDLIVMLQKFAWTWMKIPSWWNSGNDVCEIRLKCPWEMNLILCHEKYSPTPPWKCHFRDYSMVHDRILCQEECQLNCLLLMIIYSHPLQFYDHDRNKR